MVFVLTEVLGVRGVCNCVITGLISLSGPGMIGTC